MINDLYLTSLPITGMSLEQLGMRALLNLPRDRAIDGIHAYNTMRYLGSYYMKPFDGELIVHIQG